MKKLLVVLPVLFLFSFDFIKDGLTKKEKKTAISYLEKTRNELLQKVDGLNDAQLNFKPSAEAWSVKECLQHIALTEDALWKWAEGTIQSPANPEKRTEIKASDEEVMKMISDRTNKVKTGPDMYPEKSKYTTAIEAEEGFKKSRDKLITYVSNTKEDLRSHVMQTPAGWIDTYQMILFIAAHSSRHTKQIEEVMATAGFPKN